jgi:hypothetical protein
LLLAGPVKLPLLGVDMPLFAFYGFAPSLFVVLHLAWLREVMRGPDLLALRRAAWESARLVSLRVR